MAYMDLEKWAVCRNCIGCYQLEYKNFIGVRQCGSFRHHETKDMLAEYKRQRQYEQQKINWGKI